MAGSRLTQSAQWGQSAVLCVTIAAVLMPTITLAQGADRSKAVAEVLQHGAGLGDDDTAPAGGCGFGEQPVLGLWRAGHGRDSPV